MAEYRSKYYALKASITEQSITIEDALKIRMLNNLGPAFKPCLIVVNDRMRKGKKLEEDGALFKAIEEEETRIVTEQKASANFAATKVPLLPVARRRQRRADRMATMQEILAARANTPRIVHAGMQKKNVTDVI